MSVESGGGSTEDARMAEALRDAGHHVFAHLYETYAARLFDYCEGMLGDETAATDAVQDSLVAVDAQIGKLPDPDRLRVSLYSEARRQCVSKPTRRAQPSRGAGPATVDEFIAEQAGPGGAATGLETTSVAAAASGRLANRDREVLNLAFRHGIEGADLAAVLGVSPRRARTMLAEASSRFRKSAAVVAVLRSDLAGCAALAAIAGKGDAAPPPLTAELRRRLTRHLESCPQCTGQREDQVFAPEMLATVPLMTPPPILRLRITRTALALGTYRRGVAARVGAAGGNVMPVRLRAERGLPHAMVVSCLGLVILAVPGALIYQLAAGPGARRGPVAAQVAAGIQSPASASSSLISPNLAPQQGPVRPVRRPRLPSLPGLGPTPIGVLPVPSPGQSGLPPVPLPPHTTPPPSSPPGPAPPTTTPPKTPPPTTPPPTTPPPTTPPPTTPPPTTPPPTTPPPTTPPPTPSPSP